MPMRIEYLAAIAIAAMAAGTALAIGALPHDKQSAPAATQLATLLAASVDPFWSQSDH